MTLNIAVHSVFFVKQLYQNLGKIMGTISNGNSKVYFKTEREVSEGKDHATMRR